MVLLEGFRLGMETRWARDQFTQSLLPRPHLIPAPLLRLIQIPIGTPRKIIAALTRFIMRHPHTDRHTLIRQQIRRGHVPAQRLSELDSCARRDSPGYQGEFLAADTTQGIDRPNTLRDFLHQAHEYLISCSVTKAVINLLEVIDIQCQQTD